MQTDDIHEQNIWPIIDHAIFSRLAKYLRRLAFQQIRSLLDNGSLTLVSMSADQAKLILRSDLSVPDEAGDEVLYQEFAHAIIEGVDNSIGIYTYYLLRQRLFAPVHGQIPDDFWSTLTALVWLDLRFQRTVAVTMECNLRSRTFFSPGGFVSMILSPCTFWLLVSLACDLTLRQTPLNNPNKGDSNQPILEGLEKLRAVGIDQGLHSQSQWAGLWDQWILREALRRAIPGAPSEIIQELRELPLCMQNYSGTQTSKSNLAAPDWFLAVPPWFREWEGLA
jgi:hypothetical protein